MGRTHTHTAYPWVPPFVHLRRQQNTETYLMLCTVHSVRLLFGWYVALYTVPLMGNERGCTSEIVKESGLGLHVPRVQFLAEHCCVSRNTDLAAPTAQARTTIVPPLSLMSAISPTVLNVISVGTNSCPHRATRPYRDTECRANKHSMEQRCNVRKGDVGAPCPLELQL